jgi:uncharacterized protein (DUF1499 family)
VTATAHYVERAVIAGSGSELIDHAADMLQQHWRLRRLERELGSISARTKISFLSWGEDIRIEVTSNVSQSATVSISSRSVIKITLIDWGVNRRNVEKLHAELLRRQPARERP